MLETFETTLLLMALGYLSGTWLGALTVCRLAGLGDPRLSGSCNPGFSNVLRLYGAEPALATLLVDVIKGMPVLWLASWLALPPWAQGGVGFAVLLGHSYPVWHAWRGGRAVASAFGVLLMLTPPVAICCALVWSLLALNGRTSALASLTSAALAPLLTLWLVPAYSEMVIIFTLLVFTRHALYLRRWPGAR
ncbi:glycerol-3-phosphate acyltransferase [Halomonas sp. 18H]|uniref:glycerol-3-phosphate acyltransferase n=1 Tax=Halomonas almeriensis TaxID=308163 RepID=UPI002232C3D3|nr:MULTISPECIES: glycerol-3-phosphate acyltransferase [Halomonas]MCW4149432.1 glycerol-3-phosphate acyltransferase [Halomonas sp. 18H]MDN3553622.1 glycerol-3-phosphate acyltransferase [Halomonas almeriensis]